MANRFISELPTLAATGVDFNTISQEMQRIIAENPKWKSKWDTFYSGEAGSLLTEFMAFIADNLAIKIDAMINELFVSTAVRDIDKIRILKLINYVPKYAVAAKIPIIIETNVLSNNKLVVVGAYSFNTALMNRVNQIRFLNIKDVYNNQMRVEFLKTNLDGKPDYIGEYALPENNNSVSYTQTADGYALEMLEGTTKYIEFASDTSDGPFFDINDYGLASNSIQIYETDTLNKYLQVTSFIQFEALSEDEPIPYIVYLNENGSTRIEFAKKEILVSIKRRFIAGKRIGVFYRTCTGSNGNIPIDYLNTNLVVTNQINNQKISAFIRNNNVGYNGMDAETYTDAVVNGPASIRTVEKAVTPQDYNIILDNNTNFDIIQSRSYSATNQPENFKLIYGRYINPQEVFSFVITNKNYSLINPSQYNYFPWIYLKKQNVFNEKYVFDEAEYNVPVQMSNIVPELVVRQSNTQNQLYRNALVLNVSQSFNNGISLGIDAYGNSIFNTNLVLKLHKEIENNVKYFNQIPYDTIYDKESQAAIDTITSTSNYVVTENVNAKYISKNGFRVIGQMSSFTPDPDNPGQDIQFNFNQINPIDIKNYDEIKFVLDNKGEITVNLKVEITLRDFNGVAFNESIFANDTYWIYLYNQPNPYDSPQWTGTSQDARYRKGIVQLINEHMILLTETQPGEYDFYDAYQANKSYQYLNLALNDDLVYMLGFQADMMANISNYNLDKIIAINNDIYKFKFTPAIYNQAHDYFQITPKEQRYIKLNQENYKAMDQDGTLQYTAMGISLVMDFLVFAPTANPVTWQYLQKWDWANSQWVNVLEGIKGVRCDCVEIRQFSTDYEYLLNENIGSNTNENYLKWDICFYTYDEVGFASNTNYIRIEDTNLNGGNSLIFALKNLENTATLQLPAPLLAADYNNVASVYEKDFVETNVLARYQYLQITSPTVGEQSSIYFNRTNNLYDLMNYYMGIQYDNRTSTNAGNEYSSDKAYGIKRTTLILNNVTNARYGNGQVYDNVINVGNIIYEHNNINNNIDLPEIFASYKINSRNEIIIGSVFDNFVFTNDSNLDLQYKPPISGYGGQYIVATGDPQAPYRIDEGKSNFQVKFTDQPVNNNSIELVQTDLETYEVSQVHLETKTITNFNNNNIPKLIFSIDDWVDYKIEVDLGPFYNNKPIISASDIYYAIYNQIYSYSVLTNTYRNIFDNKDTIIARSYKNKNVIVLSNILKREVSNITFYYDEDFKDDNATFMLFKMLFGTEQTNPDFYELYNGIIPNDNKRQNVITNDGDTSTGTVFAPLADKPITFTYRVKKENGNVANADYYYTLEDYMQQSGLIQQQLVLHKTAASTFQDLPFYVHFVNDRTYETDQYGDLVEIEEDRYQFNMKKYKISGMDVHFAIPYFKTFDIKASIIYDRNYSYDEIWERIDETLRTNYDIKNMKISKTLSKSKIFKDLMNIIGITSCDIEYFGFDYSDREGKSPNINTLSCNFYEILCLSEDRYYQSNQVHGKIITIAPEVEDY
jgi:hypothetical protein